VLCRAAGQLFILGESVLRHRLTLTAVICAAATALAPCSAYADSASTHTTAAGAATAHAKASAQTPSASLSRAAGFKTYHSESARPTFHKASADVARPADSSGTTLYVSGGGYCTDDTGTGSATNPFCSIQDAVNAAQAGDVISVYGGDGGTNYIGPVKITTSDISIVGYNTDAWSYAPQNVDFLLDGVSNVSISDMSLESSADPAVEVVGSTGVTLSGDDLMSFNGVASGIMTVDGTSQDVTVERSTMAQLFAEPGALGVSIAAGASNIVLASDIIGSFGAGEVVADGVNGLDLAATRSSGPAVRPCRSPAHPSASRSRTR
jgi:hypothetical protein